MTITWKACWVGTASAFLWLTPATHAASGTIRDVQHVVIFVQENRSFDHYFGTLHGVRGFDDPNVVLLPTGQTVFNQPRGSGLVLLPFETSLTCLNNLAHDWDTGHSAWDGGKMDQWIPAKGTTTMSFYSRAALPFHYALADAYTVCDAYFCSVLGPSVPNRLYLMSGMIDPQGTGGGPAIGDGEPGFSWTSYPERLQNAGVSWRVYQESDNFDDNALAWFTRFRNAAPGNPLYDRCLAKVGDLVGAFKFDVTNGTLPQVSWIIAPTMLSEHPPFSAASGAVLTKQLLDALASNPTVFDSTVFLLTYDEDGGMFDHVPPPVPPPGTADEFVNGEPIGLGFRVPMIVVSPWTRGGHVCSQVFDHTSILRFLEAWTGVAEPNLSAWRRQVCGDLTSVFDFAHPDTSYPNLPTVAPVTCLLGANPTPPAVQIALKKEAGTLSARPLPYQPNATSFTDCAVGRFHIVMTNAGAASVHFAIYANAFRSDGPWAYDAAVGGSASDSFDINSFGGGRYDFTCYGPNGFQRRFAGDAATGCNEIEVSALLLPDADGLQFVLRNDSTSNVTFTLVANAYPMGGPWAYVVPAGVTTNSAFFSVTNSAGWYDLVATASSDASFLRRFAGHIEPQPPAARPGFSTTATPLSDGTLRLTFTNTPGVSFTVLRTTNLALPPVNWTVLGSPSEGPSGQFQFHDGQAATNTQAYYRVSAP